MPQDLIATASTTISVPRSNVWKALVTPAAIKKYMFGTSVTTDWREGSPITWKGEWQGKHYEDKGVILKVKPGHELQYSHFSPLAGLPDKPENYHTVTVQLFDAGAGTKVVLSQDNNSSEEARDHSENNWRMMLDALQKYLEG